MYIYIYIYIYIFNIHMFINILGNNRIRAMDDELGQQYLSSDLWEPVLDPKVSYYTCIYIYMCIYIYVYIYIHIYIYIVIY
jgi:hypothetical protein